MNKALSQNYRYNNVSQTARPSSKQPGILTIIKRQTDEDLITYSLTRMAVILTVINVINQVGIFKGWW